jgi:hypothetical protein
VYSSLNIVLEFKSKRVINVGEMINATQILKANPDSKVPLEINWNVLLKWIRLLTGVM